MPPLSCTLESVYLPKPFCPISCANSTPKNLVSAYESASNTDLARTHVCVRLSLVLKIVEMTFFNLWKAKSGSWCNGHDCKINILIYEFWDESGFEGTIRVFRLDRRISTLETLSYRNHTLHLARTGCPVVHFRREKTWYWSLKLLHQFFWLWNILFYQMGIICSGVLPSKSSKMNWLGIEHIWTFCFGRDEGVRVSRTVSA